MKVSLAYVSLAYMRCMNMNLAYMRCMNVMYRMSVQLDKKNDSLATNYFEDI